MFYLCLCLITWSLVSSVYALKLWMSYESITFLKWKMFLIAKEQEVHDFEFYLEVSLIILMLWQYFLFSEWMLEQCIFLILLFMNVKIVGSWKNNEKREMLLIIWKIIKLILEARKSSEYNACRKKSGKKKRKKKSKQKKPIAL